MQENKSNDENEFSAEEQTHPATEEQKLMNKKDDIIKRVRSKIMGIQKVKSDFIKGASDGK